uniref:Uncharacterized protein n=1 Tax=Ailuropoda melanoleuca TaxID=9646 RepID=D2IE08_AILME|nr:hypothetical protein [Ailuropoda melanoleuca]
MEVVEPAVHKEAWAFPKRSWVHTLEREPPFCALPQTQHHPSGLPTGCLVPAGAPGTNCTPREKTKLENMITLRAALALIPGAQGLEEVAANVPRTGTEMTGAVVPVTAGWQGAPCRWEARFKGSAVYFEETAFERGFARALAAGSEHHGKELHHSSVTASRADSRPQQFIFRRLLPEGLAPLSRVRTTNFGDSRRMPWEQEDCPQEPARSPWNIGCGVEKRHKEAQQLAVAKSFHTDSDN